LAELRVLTPHLEFTAMNITTIDRATVDADRVRVGAAYKLVPSVPASVRDAGRVKLGAAYKLLPRA